MLHFSFHLGLNLLFFSFGKISSEKTQKDHYCKEDIIKSLLHMIANNIGQIAYLNAKAKGIKNIFFTGGFVSENSYLWTRLSFAINFWSKGTMQVLFIPMFVSVSGEEMHFCGYCC
jgi:type II pantothenate kinase